MSDDTLYTVDDFLSGVVVDHIDGVMAEMLIDELFSNSLELA